MLSRLRQLPLQTVDLAAELGGAVGLGNRRVGLGATFTGDEIVDEKGMKIPHPRMHERAFVLAPLAEIAPELVIPGLGPIATLLKRCEDPSMKRIVD